MNENKINTTPVKQEESHTLLIILGYLSITYFSLYYIDCEGTPIIKPSGETIKQHHLCIYDYIGGWNSVGGDLFDMLMFPCFVLQIVVFFILIKKLLGEKLKIVSAFFGWIYIVICIICFFNLIHLLGLIAAAGVPAG